MTNITNKDGKENKIRTVNSLKLDMNNINIVEGDVFSNYKYLCKRLGIEPAKRGNSRNSQVEEIRRYFDYEKIEGTQKLHITEVYPEPLTREDRRKLDQTKNIYIKEQETILMYIANQIAKDNMQDDGKTMWDNDLGSIIWDTTSMNYYKTMGMINDNFTNDFSESLLKELNMEYLKNDDVKLLYELGQLEDRYIITKKKLKDFYLRASSKLSAITKTALKNLSNRAVLMYSKEFMIIKINDKGEYEYTVADNLNKGRILEAKRQAMNSMGYSNEGEIYITGHRNSYYSKINDILYKLYGWNSVYEYYHILFSKKNVLLEISEFEKNENMLSLNKKIVDYLDNSIDKFVQHKNEKALSQYNEYVESCKKSGETYMTFGEYIGEYDVYTYSKDYVNQQKFLNNKMIGID